MKGRSRDQTALRVIHEAVLCKLFHCKPSELEDEEYEKLVLFEEVYNYIAEKNPLSMLT